MRLLQHTYISEARKRLVNLADFDQSRVYVASLLAACAGKPLDLLYSRLGGISGPFFPGGWGDLSVVNYETDLKTIERWPPDSLKINWKLLESGSKDGTRFKLYEGDFRTPCKERVYDALPEASRSGKVRWLVPDEPRRWREPPSGVVQLAATGDQGFGRRLRLGAPLLHQNVASVVLESPFYGSRRPPHQRSCKLHKVSDLLTLGWATIYESIHLLHWMQQELGYKRLGICGLSMGGVHACMTAGLYPGDVAVAPLLAPRSAAVAYCDGAMREVTAWQQLLAEADDANNEIRDIIATSAQAIARMRSASKALKLLEETQQRLTVATAKKQAAAAADIDRAAAGGHEAAGARGSQQREAATASVPTPTDSAAASSSKAASADAGSSTASAHDNEHDHDEQRPWTVRRPPMMASPASGSAPPGAASPPSPPSSSLPATPAETGAAEISDTTSAAASTTAATAGSSESTSFLGFPAKSLRRSAGRAASAVYAQQQQVLLAINKLLRERDEQRQETIIRLAQVLETYTDVTRYPRPRRPDAAVIVAATNDAYVSVDSVRELHDYWPGSELRMVPGGHVSSFIFHQDHFRAAVMDSLRKVDQPPVVAAEAGGSSDAAT